LAQNKLTILGCGSALPTKQHFPSSQLLEMRGKQYLIDCGEGTQIRMRQMQLRTLRLGHIFISHLHGDHCFGTIGLITSFAMLNRTADLHIHAPAPFEQLMKPLIDFHCHEMPFKVIFHHFDTKTYSLIHSDHSVDVYSLPLNHKVPCAGFLFVEKPKDRHLLPDMLAFYKIPVSQFLKIKQGSDFTSEDGKIIENQLLTKPPAPPVRFAYCADTAYQKKLVELVQGVDLLYHEATFADQDKSRATLTCHSTAGQAATIALQANVKQLIIGHYSARYNSKSELLAQAQAVFANTILGEDMKIYEF
jgi:ribonuclease Z